MSSTPAAPKQQVPHPGADQVHRSPLKLVGRVAERLVLGVSAACQLSSERAQQFLQVRVVHGQRRDMDL